MASVVCLKFRIKLLGLLKIILPTKMAKVAEDLQGRGKMRMSQLTRVPFFEIHFSLAYFKLGVANGCLDWAMVRNGKRKRTRRSKCSEILNAGFYPLHYMCKLKLDYRARERGASEMRPIYQS
jgi:hypothetical protein